MADSDTAPRIRLPSDLSGSLKHLDDAALRRLRDAVHAEIERRDPALGGKKRDRASGAVVETGPIPGGKVNLIHASLKAGLTPAAIARNLGIPPVLVQRVLKSRRTRLR